MDSIETLKGTELPGVPLPIGDHAPVVAGAIRALQKGDWWVPGLRERSGGLLRGLSEDQLTTGSRPYKVAPASPSPALRAGYAVGLARASGRPTLVHLGIGSVADGAFHEALNLAALLEVPVIFLVAVHPLTGDAPLGVQLATTPEKLGDAFGIATTVAGPTEPEIHDAVAAAREAGGPQLVITHLKGT